MAHAQISDFVFRRNGRVYLNQRGRQFSRLLAVEFVRISGSNAGYTMFRGNVKSTGYPLHSPVSPSLPLPWVIVCHHIPTGLYQLVTLNRLPISRYSRRGVHENVIYEITYRHHKQLPFNANWVYFSMKLNSATVSLK